MRMLHVTGKFVEFFPPSSEDGEMAVATLEERRWLDGQQHICYWYCSVPHFREAWVQHCKDKSYTVLVAAMRFELLANVPSSDRNWSGFLTVQHCEIV